MLMTPDPLVTKVRKWVLAVRPPVRLSVAPSATPMVASQLEETWPLIVLAPARAVRPIFWYWPG